MAANLTSTEDPSEEHDDRSRCLPDDDTTGARSGVSRRTLVVGAAWAVPAVTVGVATPAMAASPIPANALEGIVLLRWFCQIDGTTRFEIDGSGSFPNRGIWVQTDTPFTAPTDGKLTLFFEEPGLVFTNASQPGWSNLVRRSSDDEIGGFFAYTTEYSGSWTYRDPGTADARWEANSDPGFTMPNLFYPDRCAPITAYARRTVTFNGTTVTFRRGPVTLGS